MPPPGSPRRSSMFSDVCKSSHFIWQAPGATTVDLGYLIDLRGDV
jgi:hypothetical protein